MGFLDSIVDVGTSLLGGGGGGGGGMTKAQKRQMRKDMRRKTRRKVRRNLGLAPYGPPDPVLGASRGAPRGRVPSMPAARLGGGLIQPIAFNPASGYDEGLSDGWIPGGYNDVLPGVDAAYEPASMDPQQALDAYNALRGIGQMIPSLHGLPDRFYRSPGSVRPVSELHAINPMTKKIHVWKHMGRPVLYSGDLATCKRVNKVAARAKSRSRKR